MSKPQLLALLSAVLLYFTVSLHPVWWVAWIAPVPLLYAAFQTTRREAGWLAFGAAALAYCSNAHYYWLIGGPSVVVAVVLIALQAFLWRAAVQFTHRVVTRERRWYAVFAYPVAWAALDTLVALLSPHSSFGSLAYSQGDVLPVLQVASFAGTPGVVFLLCLPASVVAIALEYRPRLRMLAPALAVVVLALVYGAVIPTVGDARELSVNIPRVRVGLLAIDDLISDRGPTAEADRVWMRYQDGIKDLARRGAEIILLPEKIEDFKTPERSREKMTMLAEAARANNVYIGAGISVPVDGRMYNRLWLVGPEAVAQYDKIHLVPGLESYLTPGDKPVVARVGRVRYGLGVCKDYHFPSFGRMYGREGVDVVLDPAWDFQEDAWMAARLSAIRGIESGFAMFRASREGLLTVTDRFGRIAAEALSSGSLIVDFAVSPGSATFYSRFGDVFGWLMVACAVALRLFD